MAALATPDVLRELGATVVALNANVDGHFPGRPSKPTPETLGDLQRFVGDGDADLGIAHDGDADRIVVLDGDGDIVHEDTVVAILAGYYTRRHSSVDGETDDDPVVVTTPNASARIDETVAAAGGRVERVWLRGDVEAAPFVGFHGESVDTPDEMVVFPAFNDLSGGTWVNVDGQEFLSPFLPAAIPAAKNSPKYVG